MLAGAVASALLAACGSGAPSTGSSVSLSGRAVTVSRPTAAATAACAAQGATWIGCLVRAHPAFGHTPLSQVSLPGAANAATQTLDPQAFDTTHGSACTEATPSLERQGTLASRWFETQDEPLTTELDQGVRYLDLQVGFNGVPNPPDGAWRVVNTLYSEYPLYDYLDQIAGWARAHPTEVVVVDLRHVCEDGNRSASVADDLWRSFTTPAPGTGTATLADVAFDAARAPSGGLAAATLDQLTTGSGGHNVVVLVPGGTPGLAFAARTAGLHPFVTSARGDAVARVIPATAPGPGGAAAAAYADSVLARAITRSKPAPGSLAGRSLAEDFCNYDLAAASPKQQAVLFGAYGGLIVPATAPAGQPKAWEAGLWYSAAGRNGIVAQLGHRANVVVSDAVEYGGFVPAVIERNGA